MARYDYTKLQNGSDIRGVALEGVEGEAVNLTAEAAARLGRGFLFWLTNMTGKGAHELTIAIEYDEAGKQHMLMNGIDVTDDIRTPEISQIASTISAHKVVRDTLLDMQREMARKHNVIMDGRDIGTVILPNADLKIFMTAG